MAQQNNKKETVAERLQGIKKFFRNFRKNTLPRIGDWLIDALDVTKDVLGVILAIVLGLIYMIFGMVIVYNPVCFIFWSLLFPRVISDMYARNDCPPIDIPKELFCFFCGWEVALLPFHWKKYFMEAHGIEHYSVRLQLKYYFRYKRTQQTINDMSPEAYKALWLELKLNKEDMHFLYYRKDGRTLFSELGIPQQIAAYKAAFPLGISLVGLMTNETIEELCANPSGVGTSNVYHDVVLKGRAVSDDRFAAIAEECPNLVGEYVLRNTPSEGMLKYMIKNESQFSKEIRYCIRRYGLSPQCILQLRDAELLEKYIPDLEVRSSCLFICQHCDPDAHRDIVREFFENTPSIPAPAQKEMELWQLQLFFKMGRELASDALTHFLCEGRSKVAECIFKNIGDTNLTPEQSAIINANPRLIELAVQYGVKYMA